MGLLGSYLENHRRAKALGTAVFVGLILLFWVFSAGKKDPVVKTTSVTGRVLRGHETPRAGQSSWIETIELPDHSKVPIWFRPPMPRAGERVPLRALHHRSGAVRYELDVPAWQSSERLNVR